MIIIRIVIGASRPASGSDVIAASRPASGSYVIAAPRPASGSGVTGLSRSGSGSGVIGASGGGGGSAAAEIRGRGDCAPIVDVYLGAGFSRQGLNVARASLVSMFIKPHRLRLLRRAVNAID